MNEEMLKGKWLEIKGEVQKAWGNLTNDELEKTKGDAKAIAGLVQQRYGEGIDVFEKKYAQIVKAFENKKNAAVDATKQSLKS